MNDIKIDCPDCGEQVGLQSPYCQSCGRDMGMSASGKPNILKIDTGPNSFQSCMGCAGGVLVALIILVILI
jgi:hypothetical protein